MIDVGKKPGRNDIRTARRGPLSHRIFSSYIAPALAPFEPIQVFNAEVIAVCCAGLSEESEGVRDPGELECCGGSKGHSGVCLCVFLTHIVSRTAVGVPRDSQSHYLSINSTVLRGMEMGGEKMPS